MESQNEWKIKIDIPPEVRDHPFFKKLRDDVYERALALICPYLPLVKARADLERLGHIHGKEKLAMAVKLSQSTQYDYRHWLQFDAV